MPWILNACNQRICLYAGDCCLAVREHDRPVVEEQHQLLDIKDYRGNTNTSITVKLKTNKKKERENKKNTHKVISMS